MLKSVRFKALIKYIFISICVLLNTVKNTSLNFSGDIFNKVNIIISAVLSNITLTNFLIIISFICILEHAVKTRKIKFDGLTNSFNVLYSIILSIFISYGIMVRRYGFDDISLGKVNLFILLFKAFGISYLVVKSLQLIENLFGTVPSKSVNNDKKEKVSLIRWFILILICWIPYFAILYPGIVNGDTINQLYEFFGHGDWVRDDYPIGWYLLRGHPFSITNQHNFFVTLLYGANVKLGYTLFNNPSVGLFFNAFLQSLLMIAVFVYSLVTFERLGMPYRSIKKIGLFFAIFPMLPIISMFITKNIIYSAFFLFFILLLVNALNNNSLYKKTSWNIAVICSIIGQFFSEKYAVYILIFVFIYNIVFYLKDKNFIRLNVIIFISLIVLSAFQIGLFRYLSVPNGDPIEGESVLIQSTALYEKEHYKDATHEENNVINKVFVRKNLASLYNPVLSDPVKSSGRKKVGLQANGKYNSNLLKEFKEGYRYRTVNSNDIKEYKKTWIQLMLRHPAILLQAFMNQGYKYLDINSTQENVDPRIPSDALNLCYANINIPLKHGNWIRIEPSRKWMGARAIIALAYNCLSKIPPISILLNGNQIIAVVIVLSLVLLSMRLYKQLQLLLIFLSQVPIFVLSPLNGSQRYMYIFILGIGIIIGLMMCWIRKAKNR